MMGKTSIEWCTDVWNPVTGCTKVSLGCKNCYAERVFPRAYGRERKFTDVMTHSDRLDQPLHWRKPRRIFVNSMSDLFHESVPEEFIDQVWAVMALSPQHCFQILTKRPERMRNYLDIRRGEKLRYNRLLIECNNIRHKHPKRQLGSIPVSNPILWPLPNLWLGISAENQEMWKDRWDSLRCIWGYHTFLSYEPALGPLEFRPCRACNHPGNVLEWPCSYCKGRRFEMPDWVIAGGESGPNARPCDLAWIRFVRDQCRAAAVPFFYKQGGSSNSCEHDRKGGHFDCFPSNLKIREFPTCP